MIKHANISYNTGESTEKFTGCAKGNQWGGSCGKFQYESPLRILGRGEGAEEKEKRNTEIIPPIENAFLLKTKPDFERAAVDSLDRWCQ